MSGFVEEGPVVEGVAVGDAGASEEEEFEIMPERDLVLREGLEILADLIEFQTNGPEDDDAGAAPAEPPVEDLIRALETVQ